MMLIPGGIIPVHAAPGDVLSTVEINSTTANGPVLSNDDRFGKSVANIGDLDGDGVSDIAVGADRDDVGGFDIGALHIIFLNGVIPITVTIDIKLGSDPNCFNNNGNGVIPVAIFGTAELDVSTIDAETVELESIEVKAVGKSNKLLAHIEDSDGDGIDDLIVQIEDEDGIFEIGNATATLTGNLLNGTLIQGIDGICITQ